MKPSRFTHITFAVKNMAESLEFYHQWFGLVVHLDRRPQGNTVWITTADQSDRETPEFVLVVHEGEISRIHHFGFQMESRADLDAVAEKAKAAGVLREGPVDVGGAVGSFLFIEDPNGHMWEFTAGQPLVGL